jgi:hypothetical protein
MNLNDRSVLFPKNLVAAHDRQAEIERFRLAEEKKAKEAEKANSLRGLFQARFEQLNRYSFQMQGLIIRPAASYEEFIDEGSVLRHCVAGYAERHAKGETALFWIRKTEAPDEPYYTLQFNEKTQDVVQNRGKNNCDRTPEITAFELRWLEHARQVAAAKNKSNRRRKKEDTAA